MKCELCSKEMVKRKGTKGEFWGCAGYPDCKNTKPIKEEVNTVVSTDGKFTTMYVSYVKDLVVAGKELEEAIDIVKQTREAFNGDQ